MQKVKLLIIRHGDPDYVHDTLTERGRAEAEALSGRLMRECVRERERENENLTKVYCSPMGRAQATAAPFLAASGRTADTREWLREIPYRIHQPLRAAGLAMEDRDSAPWKLSPALFSAYADQLSDVNHWQECPIYREAGELVAYVEKVRKGFDALLAENGILCAGDGYRLCGVEPGTQRTLAIFCHMGLGLLLLSQLARMSPPLAWQRFCFQPSSVSTVLWEQDEGAESAACHIVSIGDTTHLSELGPNYRF